MAAAEITPTMVHKTYVPSTNVYGTPKRIVKYLIQITKVTQSDWVVGATYCTGTYMGGVGWTIDSSGDGAIETLTYAASGTKIVFGSANVGTAYAEVMYYQ